MPPTRLETEDAGLIEVDLPLDLLTGPIHSAAGVIDINSIFSAIPEVARNQYGQYPNLNSFSLSRFLFYELGSEVFRLAGTRELKVPGLQLTHSLFPIVEGGIIADIAHTQLFQRTLGIHQLGINSYSPLPNPHNRGEHMDYLAVNMARTLHSVYQITPDQLLATIARDLLQAGLPVPATPDQLLHLYTDLAMVVATTHDLATPAGGDTLKYLLKLDEEADLEYLLSSNCPILKGPRRELLEVLQKHGLNSAHLDFVIACVQGKSDSLIGHMIHPPQGDHLDWDRKAYTLLDCQAATLLDAEVPESVVRISNSELDARAAQKLALSLQAFYGDFNAVLSLDSDPPSSLPTTLLDESDHYFLDPQGRLVSSQPHRLAWIAVYRTWMTAHHYAGAQMLGLEWELQQKLNQLMAAGSLSEILNRDRLLTFTDHELFDHLRSTDDTELTEILARADQFGTTTQFSGHITRQEAPPGTAYAAFPLKLKPGLDSLVFHQGKTITLKEYIASQPHSLVWLCLQQGLNWFKEGNVNIYKK